MLGRLHLIGEHTSGSMLLTWHRRLLAVPPFPAAVMPAARPMASRGSPLPLLLLLVLLLLLLLPVQPSTVTPAPAPAIAQREALQCLSRLSVPKRLFSITAAAWPPPPASASATLHSAAAAAPAVRRATFITSQQHALLPRQPSGVLHASMRALPGTAKAMASVGRAGARRCQRHTR